MGTRGRKSAASLSVLSVAALPMRIAVARMAPPAALIDAERAIWVATCAAMPGGWFGGEQVPLLARYCCHAARADAIEQRLRELDPVADVDGYGKLARLAAMESKAMLGLARSMRLTLAARTHAVTAARRAATGGERPGIEALFDERFDR
jgi:hypothetical protein